MPDAGTSRPQGVAARAGRSFAAYAWAVLAFNLAVVLWGAYVRATGSGAGCGNHWPLCNGEVVPRSPTLGTVIEYTHRVTSGLDLVLVAVLAIWAFRAYPRRHSVRTGAALSAVFLISEALLGASLVLLEHVARNASVTRAYSLSAHLVNTLTLLACLALTAWWASGGPAVRVRGRLALRCGASLAAVVLVGVSGAIAALGDTLFPPSSLAAGLRADFAPAVHLFVRLRVLHPVLAAALGAGLALLVVPAAFRGGNVQRRLGWTLAALVGAQLMAGMLNLLLLAPIWMQLVHLLLGDLLWLSLVLLCAADLAKPSRAAALG